MSNQQTCRFEDHTSQSEKKSVPSHFHDHGDGNFHASHDMPLLHDHGDGNFHASHDMPLLHDHGDGNFHASHDMPFLHDHGDGNFHASHDMLSFLHDHGDGNFHSFLDHIQRDHGHAHERLDHPGSFDDRPIPSYEERDWSERAFTIGIGGPVGSGKTALMLALCQALRDKYSIAVVTNDIFTREDTEFLVRHNALPEERIVAIETGGCPHAAIREDISANLNALETLHAKFNTQLLLIESGGDNLAANYSRELADYIIYVIDVAGGDKIPRKGGPGITQSDLLVINKTDLAEIVGADLNVMAWDARKMRGKGPTVLAQVKNGVGVDKIVELVLGEWKASGAAEESV